MGEIQLNGEGGETRGSRGKNGFNNKVLGGEEEGEAVETEEEWVNQRRKMQR